MELQASLDPRPKNSFVIFGAGLVAGLMLGLFTGTVILKPNDQKQVAQNVLSNSKGARGEDYTRAFAVVNVPSLWTAISMDWNRQPPFRKAGKLPLTFETPALMYDYGGMSDPIPADMVKADTIVRVDISQVSGIVGLSLVDPAGNPIFTQEQTVTSADGDRSVFFKIGPQDLPAAVLVRNFGDSSGKPGSISIDDLSYAPIDAFSDSQMDALNAIGLNKTVSVPRAQR